MKCSKCGETINPGETYLYCAEHRDVHVCEKCGDRMQRACPYDKDPLDVDTVPF